MQEDFCPGKSRGTASTWSSVCKDERLDHVTELFCVPWKLVLSDVSSSSSVRRMVLYNVK